MLCHRYVFEVLAGIALSSVLVSQVSGYVVHTDPRWKLEGWENKNPGFKARISPRGLTYLKNVGINILHEKLQWMALPDIHGSAGSVEYDITNMYVPKFAISSNSYLLTDVKRHGLFFSSGEVAVSVQGDWHYKKGIFHGSGNFDAIAADMGLRLTIRIGIDSNGRPKVYSQESDCAFSIMYLDVELHGGSSWFVKMFKKKIVEGIMESMNTQLCSNIVYQVNTELENKMQTLKMVAPIENVAVIDYSLVASPDFNGSVTTANKGEVYPMYGNRSECPIPVPNIPPDPESASMVYLWITEYLPNSAGYVLQNVGYLQYNVTPDNVPPAEMKYLNTSNIAFKTLIPEISKLYPNMAMQINLNSTKAPVGNIKPDGVQAVFVGDFSPYAILPNKTLAFLFTLNVTINANVNVNTSGNNITWRVSSLSTKMSLVRSVVGHFSTFMLEKAVNIAIRFYFIKQLNEYGAIGVPLPQVDNIEFSKPVFTLGQGFIKIGTDLQYLP